jgi:hypothetical protein
MTFLYFILGVVWLLILRSALRHSFGCHHRHTTFPMQLHGEECSHVSCLDCGRRFPHGLLDVKRRKEELL